MQHESMNMGTQQVPGHAARTWTRGIDMYIGMYWDMQRRLDMHHRHGQAA
jgi:hypothetical protein